MRRNPLFCGLLCFGLVAGLTGQAGAQAQTASPAMALPDFTGIVQRNAPHGCACRSALHSQAAYWQRPRYAHARA